MLIVVKRRVLEVFESRYCQCSSLVDCRTRPVAQHSAITGPFRPVIALDETKMSAIGSPSSVFRRILTVNAKVVFSKYRSTCFMNARTALSLLKTCPVSDPDQGSRSDDGNSLGHHPPKILSLNLLGAFYHVVTCTFAHVNG